MSKRTPRPRCETTSLREELTLLRETFLGFFEEPAAASEFFPTQLGGVAATTQPFPMQYGTASTNGYVPIVNIPSPLWVSSYGGFSPQQASWPTINVNGTNLALQDLQQTTTGSLVQNQATAIASAATTVSLPQGTVSLQAE